jgi:hypothetical protein
MSVSPQASTARPLTRIALCAGLLLPTFSASDARAAARNLAAEAIEAYQARDFSSASQNLDKAYRLFATPTLGLWSARASYQLGRWVEAAERYREAQRASADIGDAATQRQAQRGASDEVAAALPKQTWRPMTHCSPCPAFPSATLAVVGVATWFLAPRADSREKSQSFRLNVGPPGVDVPGVF